MIDSGVSATTGWRPSRYSKYQLGREVLDDLFVTNADRDHLSDLGGLWTEEISVTTLTRNAGVSPAELRSNLAAISLLLAVAAPPALYVMGCTVNASIAVSCLFLGQYVVAAIAAGYRGFRFVTNVLALHSSRRVTATVPGKPKTVKIGLCYPSNGKGPSGRDEMP